MPRRKPFSNKQKKLQLQQKREKERQKDGKKFDWSDDKEKEAAEERDELANSGEDETARSPGAEKKALKFDPNRFRMEFERESREELEKRKHLAKMAPIVPVSETDMEVGLTDIYGDGEILDFPKRPPWNYSTSKEKLLEQEEATFSEFLHSTHSKHGANQLSYFEHNLETWRQLWRVLEMSDLVLLIADIRHPVLHFSRAVYRYVVEELKKKLILVLNKVDLVPPQVGVAWRHYFLSQFPQLDVVCFTSYPNKEVSTSESKKAKLKLRSRRGRLPVAVGPHELLKLVEKIYHDQVDLDPWRQKLSAVPSGTEECLEKEEEEDGVGSGAEMEDDGLREEEEEVADNELSEEVVSLPSLERAKEGVLTIGMVGHPNVGKSSIINALMAKKLVSTSRTPGHTKHFQTLYLTPSLRLCDCPGLVFPSLVDKQLQILSGLYPVSQVREPYTAIGYLAQRVPLASLLQLTHPEEEEAAPGMPAKKSSSKRRGRRRGSREEGVEEGGAGASGGVKQELVWTAWDVCDSWADKKRFYTSRAARPDTYRAANSILRLAVDGRICMYFRPPGFHEYKNHWESHPEVAELVRLQTHGMAAGGDPSVSTVLRYQLEEDVSPLQGRQVDWQEGTEGGSGSQGGGEGNSIAD